MERKPRILITNDDSIYSKGLKTLWKALVPHAEIFVVAPANDRSGASLAITYKKPLHIEEVPWESETQAWKVTGTPADCVKLALSVLLKEPPNLIVSGVNDGSNAGRTVLYSGTVGGVIEGGMRRIPGIAFSLVDMGHADFSIVEPYILPLVQHVLEVPLPHGTILNVNFPSSGIKGVKLARQGKSYWTDNPDKRIHPEGAPYFWLGGKWDDHEEHDDSDVALLNQGFATVVPIHIDELTDHALLRERKESFEKLFN